MQNWVNVPVVREEQQPHFVLIGIAFKNGMKLQYPENAELLTADQEMW